MSKTKEAAPVLIWHAGEKYVRLGAIRDMLVEEWVIWAISGIMQAAVDDGESPANVLRYAVGFVPARLGEDLMLEGRVTGDRREFESWKREHPADYADWKKRIGL